MKNDFKNKKITLLTEDELKSVTGGGPFLLALFVGVLAGILAASV